ncbi:MAG TPA: hypothetical protein VJN18_01970 [Polyangiaceae bacterium]|nr:hypothetical protein [Polyangiaceae bacterium]
MLGDVVQDGALKGLRLDPVAGAGFLAAAAEASAIVVAVWIALGVALARAFELAGVAATAAVQEPGQEERAGRQATRILTRVTTLTEFLGHVEELLVNDGVDGDADPFAFWADALAA